MKGLKKKKNKSSVTVAIIEERNLATPEMRLNFYTW